MGLSGLFYPETYLDEYVTAYIDDMKNGVVYAYLDPRATGSNSRKTEISEGTLVKVIAQRGDRVCVIVPGSGKAGWVGVNYIETDPVIPGSDGSTKPSAADLDAIFAHITYPTDKQYFDAYKTASVKSTKSAGVYAFADPKTNMSGFYFLVYDGEEVTILGERGGFYCVVFHSRGRAAWINKNYLVIHG